MARMARVSAFLGLSLLTFISTGCVSAEKYNAQKIRGDQLSEQLAAAQSQVNSATAERDVLRQQLGQIRNSGDGQAALLVNQATTVAELTRQLEDMKARYNEALGNVAKAGNGALPVALTNELTTFAAQNPDLVDFDSARGLVKFKSDVTFSAGSAELQSPAKSAIDRFAQILNSASAAPYDLMVVGHTDSQPVSNPATVKAGHRDNWYLSAHRAITVAAELRQKSVSPTRLEVAGFADQRPVDTSGTKDGMAHNRRVEVLILPTTGHAPAMALSPAPAPAAKGVAKQPMNKDLNKDQAVEVERKPYLSK